MQNQFQENYIASLEDRRKMLQCKSNSKKLGYLSLHNKIGEKCCNATPILRKLGLYRFVKRSKKNVAKQFKM